MINAIPGHSSAPLERFRHAALFYAGETDFLHVIGAFVRDGVTADEPTLVVVDAAKIAALKGHIGGLADQVCFADMAEVGANPGRIISAWDDFLAERGGDGKRVRGVGEPIHPGRSDDELAECHRHEALLNLAFADAPGFWLLCPYDTDALSAEVVEHARATHPLVIEGGAEHHSAAYGGLQVIAEPQRDPLPEPPADAEMLPFDADALPRLRNLVSEYAASAGLSRERAEDLLLAINEIATNSVRHAGGSGLAKVWRDDDAIVCEIRDTGAIDAPLAGRLRPTPGDPGGYGLWMANQLCDLVQVRVRPDGGLVRLHVRAA